MVDCLVFLNYNIYIEVVFVLLEVYYMTIEEMKKLKEEYGYTNNIISQLSGVPLGTVQKIFSGETAHPRYSTLQELEHMFNDEYRSRVDGMLLEESHAVYGERVQGEYTVEDYLALPEERRVELIDGCIYDMGAPTAAHQMIVGDIHRQISNYIIEKDGKCLPFISPTDVQLDCDNKTMLQPDVFIVCDPKKLTQARVWGAPEFVAEVISKSTKSRDYGKKLAKYMDAGVKEYWIIDRFKKSILVYDLQGDVCPTIYPIDADIPVKMYDGELVINLSRVIDILDNMEVHV